MAAEYLFVDEWDVDAPRERVFDALADARTYPDWWTPIYKEVHSDGGPELGRASTQRFSAKLGVRRSVLSPQSFHVFLRTRIQFSCASLRSDPSS